MNDKDAHFTEKDREVLIRTSVQVGIAIEDIKEIKNNFSGRIQKLENESFYVKGALALIVVVSTLVVYIYFTAQTIQDNKIDSLIAQLQTNKLNH